MFDLEFRYNIQQVANMIKMICDFYDSRGS